MSVNIREMRIEHRINGQMDEQSSTPIEIDESIHLRKILNRSVFVRTTIWVQLQFIDLDWFLALLESGLKEVNAFICWSFRSLRAICISRKRGIFWNDDGFEH